MGNQASHSSFHRDIGIPINFQEESGLGTFWSIEHRGHLKVSRDVRPPLQMRLGSRAFSRTAQKFQTSLYLARWKMSMHSSYCTDIRLSFESGNLGIHCTWVSKFRVPLTYWLLREGSSWGACGKVAYFFIRILWISSLLEMIWGAWSFPWISILKLIFILMSDWCLRESL